MSTRTAKRLLAAFILVYIVALVWPGVLPFNRIHPFVLGMPFSFAWVVLWTVLGFIVFAFIDVMLGRGAASARESEPRKGG